MSVPALEPSGNDDGPLKEEPVNYAPKKARSLDPLPQVNAAPKVPQGIEAASPSRGTSEAVADPPWKGKKARGLFEGDIAAAELRSRLALAPDRISEPLSPPSSASVFAAASPFLGGILVAAVGAGIIGYLWGSGPPAKPPPFTPTSDQAALPQKPSAPAVNIRASNLDSEPPATPTATAAVAPADARNEPTDAVAVGAEQPLTSPAAESQAALAPFVPRPLKPPVGSSANEIALKMKKGVELLANGDIAAARMIFLHAAEAGEPMAAFALAETYDPVALRKFGTRGGITSDVALAQKWYEKARDMGSTAAPERIVRLTRLPE